MSNVVDYNRSRVPVLVPDGFPDWAGIRIEDCSESFFVDDVKDLQEELGLDVDGFCGPNTIDAIAGKSRGNYCWDSKNPYSKLVSGPRAYHIGAPLVTYMDNPTLSEKASRIRRSKPTQIVIHYDVTFSYKDTKKILKERGLSYHFIIDGDDDGTIYQCKDPATETAFHAGKANNRSIGIVLNNPADPKFLSRDESNRGRSRRVISDNIHGEDIERLDFFDEQLDSARKLVGELCRIFNIPREYPKSDDGGWVSTVLEQPLDFEGVLGHYHLTRSKTDPSPLDWDIIIP